MNEDKRGAGDFEADEWAEENECRMTWSEWMALFGEY